MCAVKRGFLTVRSVAEAVGSFQTPALSALSLSLFFQVFEVKSNQLHLDATQRCLAVSL